MTAVYVDGVNGCVYGEIFCHSIGNYTVSLFEVVVARLNDNPPRKIYKEDVDVACYGRVVYKNGGTSDYFQSH